MGRSEQLPRAGFTFFEGFARLEGFTLLDGVGPVSQDIIGEYGSQHLVASDLTRPLAERLGGWQLARGREVGEVRLEVLVPEEHLGAVIGDLRQRHRQQALDHGAVLVPAGEAEVEVDVDRHAAGETAVELVPRPSRQRLAALLERARRPPVTGMRLSSPAVRNGPGANRPDRSSSSPPCDTETSRLSGGPTTIESGDCGRYRWMRLTPPSHAALYKTASPPGSKRAEVTIPRRKVICSKRSWFAAPVGRVASTA